MKFLELLTEDLTTTEIKKVLTPEVKELGNIFKKNGFELRIVGGAVRDLLLGKKPKDIDFATDATPTEMMEFLDKAGYKTIPTGIEHGTISVLGELDEPYEITTLRIDKETDGRHAEVEFTRDFKEDAARRDLTFNAMSIDMNGKVYDYFGGIKDLRNSKAKFVGDATDRINEDYLRILRYFRFIGRMRTPEFHASTINAIKENAEGLADISGERIWAELYKILAGNHAEEIIKKICEVNVAQYIDLQCGTIDGLNSIVQHPIIRLAYILDTSEATRAVIRRWKLSKEERELLKFLVSYKNIDISLIEAQKMLVENVPRTYLVQLFQLQRKYDEVNQIASWKMPAFPVTGKDLIALGYKPGPEFGKILTALKEKWKDSGYTLTRDDLMQMLEEVNNE